MQKIGEPGKYRAKQLLVMQATGLFVGPGEIVELKEPAFIAYALKGGLIEPIEDAPAETEQEG